MAAQPTAHVYAPEPFHIGGDSVHSRRGAKGMLRQWRNARTRNNRQGKRPGRHYEPAKTEGCCATDATEAEKLEEKSGRLSSGRVPIAIGTQKANLRISENCTYRKLISATSRASSLMRGAGSRRPQWGCDRWDGGRMLWGPRVSGEHSGGRARSPRGRRISAGTRVGRRWCLGACRRRPGRPNLRRLSLALA